MAQGGGGLGMTQSNVGYGNIGRNLAPAQAPNGEVQTGINNAIQNGYMAPNPQNSISGIRTAYAGNCDVQYTARQHVSPPVSILATFFVPMSTEK